jgi:hypothetical protein
MQVEKDLMVMEHDDSLAAHVWFMHMLAMAMMTKVCGG